MGRGPCLTSLQRPSLAESSWVPWGNWHLWFDRLWERVCCMAQLGTLDCGRKLSHPEVGGTRNHRVQPHTPQTAKLRSWEGAVCG